MPFWRSRSDRAIASCCQRASTTPGLPVVAQTIADARGLMTLGTLLDHQASGEPPTMQTSSCAGAAPAPYEMHAPRTAASSLPRTAGSAAAQAAALSCHDLLTIHHDRPRRASATRRVTAGGRTGLLAESQSPVETVGGRLFATGRGSYDKAGYVGMGGRFIRSGHGVSPLG